MTKIRTATVADHPAILSVAETSGLFSSEDIPMLESGLSEPDAGQQWFIAETGEGAAMVAPEAMAPDVWNLLFLAVDPAHQRQGLARALIGEVEAQARQSRVRLLLIDTSSDADQSAARAAYDRLGYRRIATIPDYWADGSDRITFLKRL